MVEEELAISKRDNDFLRAKLNEKQSDFDEKLKAEKKDLLKIIVHLKKESVKRLNIPEGVTLQKISKSMKFLVKNGQNTLISSTIPFLLKNIVDLQNTEYSLTAFGLFLHHRLFIPSEELLEALLMRWRDKNGENGEEAVKESERYFSTRMIKRVSKLLEIWLQNFFFDFRDEPKNLSLITNYVNRESTSSDPTKVNNITGIIKEKVISIKNNRRFWLMRKQLKFKH